MLDRHPTNGATHQRCLLDLGKVLLPHQRGWCIMTTWNACRETGESICPSLFSVSVIKHSNQKHLEERVYYACISLRKVRAWTKRRYFPEGTLLAGLLRLVLS